VLVWLNFLSSHRRENLALFWSEALCS
jgi:hypothetical protein